jgi:PHP family Zn ribbon phosphoesterase
MTPANIAAMAELAGYDVIALSDHNTVKNCRPAISAARQSPLLVLPAMELTTAEEAHVLCLFSDLDAAESFGEYVYSRLPDIENDPEFFGEQRLMDDTDGILGFEKKMLINATDIGINEISSLAESYGGIAIPAHIDRSSFSILSNLGYFDRTVGFDLCELSRQADVRALAEQHPELEGLGYIVDSDAHSLGAMPDAEKSLECGEKTAASVIASLRRGTFLQKIHPFR